MEVDAGDGLRELMGEAKLPTPHVLLEDELRQIGRKSPNQSSHDPFSTDQFLQNVIFTLTRPNLHPPHAAAAISALCSVIDRDGSNHGENSVRNTFNASLADKMFDICLLHSENLKSKPARRLLTTASDLAFLKSPQQHNVSLLHHVTIRCLEAITLVDSKLSVKAALQILDHFLNKSFLNARTLLEASRILSLDSAVKRIEGVPFVNPENRQTVITHLLSNLFAWIRYPDCAPVISRLLAHFLQSLTSSDPADDWSIAVRHDFWVEPVGFALKEDPEVLEAFEDYVFPVLFSLSSLDIQTVSQSLPFRAILGKNYGHCNDAEIRMCLMIVKTLQMSKRLDTLSRKPIVPYDLE